MRLRFVLGVRVRGYLLSAKLRCMQASATLKTVCYKRWKKIHYSLAKLWSK